MITDGFGLSLALIGVVLLLLYKFLTKNYDYWAKQNVPFLETRLLFGSTQFDKPLHEVEKDCYEKYGRIYGRFDGSTPVLTVADPDLLKRILVQDFDVFQNHRDLKSNDPIMDNTLFILDGSDWKRVRNIVSPIFTGSKLKKMIPLLSECCDDVARKCDEAFKKDEAIKCLVMFKKFVLSCVARCSFGIRITPEEEDILLEKANKVFSGGAFSWRTVIVMIFPSLMKLFRVSLLNPDSIDFFLKFLMEVVNSVKTSTIEGKSDFLQRIIKAEAIHSFTGKKPEVADHPEVPDATDHNKSSGLSRNEALAQCVSFFMAGLDPTTALLSYSLYQLALNDEYQQRALREIKDVLAENENDLSYEAISQMKFLDAVICEVLRLVPSLVRSERRVERDYELQGTNIRLKKGMLVSVPTYAMQRDPEFFPDPDSFRPERFLDPEMKPPAYVHLPFGAGPRVCLGKRFVEVTVKLCLARLLLKYRVAIPDTYTTTPKIVELRGTLSIEEIELKFLPRDVKTE